MSQRNGTVRRVYRSLFPEQSEKPVHVTSYTGLFVMVVIIMYQSRIDSRSTEQIKWL